MCGLESLLETITSSEKMMSKWTRVERTLQRLADDAHLGNKRTDDVMMMSSSNVLQHLLSIKKCSAAASSRRTCNGLQMTGKTTLRLQSVTLRRETRST